MSRITQRPAVAPLEVFKQATSTSAGTGTVDSSFVTYVGQKFDTSDGRVLTLVSNGAAALVSGTLIQAPAEVTAFQKLAMTVPTAYPATAGLNQILVTNGSTVLNINQFAQGYVVVASGTGIGQTLKIQTHQPAANAATFVVTLEDPIQVTLDATSKISLVYNPYIGVITNPTTATAAPIGVAFYPVAAATANTYNATTGALATTGVAQYALIVSTGPVGCLVDNTVTNVGYPLGRSAATEGAVGVASLTTAAAVGTALQTLTSANAGLIYINL